MDKAALFRKLVTGESVFDFNNINNWFSFTTVFYRSTYAYRFCTCGFEHEYLMYLSETGEVNEEMFESLVKNVADGKCPHVDHASKHQLIETSVHGVHLAAAKGNELAVRRSLDTFDTSVGGIFKLLALDIAILKGNYPIANMYFKYVLDNNKRIDLVQPMPTVKILNTNPVKICLEGTTRTQICVQSKDEDLLKIASMQQDSIHFSQALRNTYKQGLADEFGIFSNLVKFHACIVDQYIESAIIYNQPEALDRLLKLTACFDSKYVPTSPKRMLQPGGMSQVRPFRNSPYASLPTCSLPLRDENYLCNVLNRKACKKVLSDNGFLHQEDVATEVQIMILLSRLRDFYDDCKEEIITALTNIPRNQRSSSNNLNNYLTLPHIKNDLFKTVLDLGANVNYKDPFGKTPIGKLLQIRTWHDGVLVREKVALLINENPDIELHERDVRRGIKRDALLQARHINIYDMPGEYRADAQEHGLFGYDDEDTFALNFIGPFLIECGFQAKRSDLQNLLSRYSKSPFSLHPAEVSYIQRYIDTPRSLVVNCRDSLRKHFKGRRINDFVERSGCPQKIKDIILINQVTTISF